MHIFFLLWHIIYLLWHFCERLGFRLFCILCNYFMQSMMRFEIFINRLESFNWKHLKTNTRTHLQLWLIITVLIVWLAVSTNVNNNATAIRMHSYILYLDCLKRISMVFFFIHSFCISSFTTFNLSEMKNHDVTHTYTICNRHIIIMRVLLFFLFFWKNDRTPKKQPIQRKHTVLQAWQIAIRHLCVGHRTSVSYS